MDYLSKNVAANLKRIRKSKCMSLDQTAEQTGVSKSMLAQIERGTANPSLGVLGKVTSGISGVDTAAPGRLSPCNSTGTAADQRAGRAIPGMDLSAI